jgi:hypothetical protein
LQHTETRSRRCSPFLRPPAPISRLECAATRDLLASANAKRPFYVVGERGIHAPGPANRPSTEGTVSRMIGTRESAELQRHYRAETALQSAPGYADVAVDSWKSNGFGTAVREYYAGGFFSTGYDAERLGDIPSARYWYEAACA